MFVLLSYKVFGTRGDWVVCLHGIGGSSSIFYRQVRELRRDYRVLLIDLPGHGNSGSIDTDSLSVASVVDEIIEVVDYLKIDRFHLFGVSLGTLLAHEWIKRGDGRIRSSIMAGGVIRFNRLGSVLVSGLRVVRSFIPLSWLYPVLAYVLMPRRSHRLSRGAFIKDARSVAESDFQKWFGLLGEVEGIYDPIRLMNSGVSRYYITGENDYMFIEGVRSMIDVGDDSVVAIISGAGHVCNIDNHVEFNRLLLDILEAGSGECADGLAE